MDRGCNSSGQDHFVQRILEHALGTSVFFVGARWTKRRILVSSTSDNPLTGQTQPATPSAPGTGGARNQCGFSTPETQGKASPGKVSGGKLIHSVRPEYPAAARKAHIQGTVVLCATIAKDGKLRNVRAFSGPEELIPSAIKAVEQWRYQPYLKNNEPVDVDSEIHLGFKLSP